MNEGVLTIGGNCFRECKGLKKLTLPSTITYLDGNCLSGTGLRELKMVSTTPPARVAYPFGNDLSVLSQIKLLVPSGSIGNWNGVDPWKRFTIEEY